MDLAERNLSGDQGARCIGSVEVAPFVVAEHKNFDEAARRHVSVVLSWGVDKLVKKKKCVVFNVEILLTGCCRWLP